MATKPKLKKKPAADHAQAKDKSLMDSAHQVWMAGLAAFNRAQGEGGKLFENLVREGVALEQKTRRFATGKVDEARDVVETKVAQVRERAQDTWDRLEKVFEDRVARALTKLGVPARDELQALLDRVEELNRSIRKGSARAEVANAGPARRAPRKAARKSARKA